MSAQPPTPSSPDDPDKQSFPRVPPELIAWAKEPQNIEEVLADLRHVLAHGGKQLHEFIDELEAKALGRE
jgi:hypothetical protein